MCGIYGKFCFEDAINFDACFSALELLAHRGPDGYGIFCGDYRTGDFILYHNAMPTQLPGTTQNYFLGHRRLSIIDLNANAFQPMCTEDKNYIIVLNGEIYNYCELKDELEKDGYRFFTDHSDTEVLLNSYRRWGDKCLHKLRGMFAFAIYDRLKNKVFMARDRVGQKTLYYQFSEKNIIFASELTPIVKCETQKLKIDEEALAQYLTYGYIPFPKSVFAGIKKLAPASYAWIDLYNRTLDIHQYWDIEIGSEGNKSFKDWKRIIDECLKESVALRLRADVPIGVFSSGGIDSTLVLQKVSQMGLNRIDSYSADFPQPRYSERKYIQIANKKYKAHLNLMMIGTDAADNIDDIISVFDEPFDGGSSIALFKMFDRIKNHKKIMLTGDGGDEIFGGYERYSRHLRRKLLKNFLKYSVVGPLFVSVFEHIGLRSDFTERLKRILTTDEIEHYINFDKKSKLTRLLKKPIPHLDFYKYLLPKMKPGESVKNLQYLEFKTILPGRMLYKLDRFSMHFGIEARSPFLDHNLIELAFMIPTKVNVGLRKTKEILKSILMEDFDREFVNRKKTGFGNPIDYWFKNLQPEQTYGVLNDRDSVIFHFLDFKKTHDTFPEIAQGYTGKNTNYLWRLTVLARYLENSKNFIQL